MDIASFVLSYWATQLSKFPGVITFQVDGDQFC